MTGTGKKACIQELLFDDTEEEALLLLLDMDDEEKEAPKVGLKKHVFGEWETAGSWEPHKRQQPELNGIEGWRHQWWKSRLWIMLQDDDTKDPSTYRGSRFRSLLGVPRVIFDELVVEAQQWRGTQDHRAGDGVKAPPTIPAKLKLATLLVWLRSASSFRFAAFFAGHMDDNTAKR